MRLIVASYWQRYRQLSWSSTAVKRSRMRWSTTPSSMSPGTRCGDASWRGGLRLRGAFPRGSAESVPDELLPVLRARHLADSVERREEKV